MVFFAENELNYFAFSWSGKREENSKFVCFVRKAKLKWWPVGAKCEDDDDDEASPAQILSFFYSFFTS